jgi:hypothetical protein
VTSVTGTFSSLALGIAEVGGVLVAPHVIGTSNYQVGVNVSFDSGASWLQIPGGARFGNLNYLRAIVCNDRVAIVSQDSVAITGPIAAFNRVNSVSL